MGSWKTPFFIPMCALWTIHLRKTAEAQRRSHGHVRSDLKATPKAARLIPGRAILPDLPLTMPALWTHSLSALTPRESRLFWPSPVPLTDTGHISLDTKLTRTAGPS